MQAVLNNNMYVGTKYYYLKQLALKSAAKRMAPDYISAKVMMEVDVNASCFK